MANLKSTQKTTQTKRQTLVTGHLYKVFVVNYAFAPMEFVVDIFMECFSMDYQTAQLSTLCIYEKGFVLGGVYPETVAKQKVEEVTHWIDQSQFSLLCQMEPI